MSASYLQRPFQLGRVTLPSNIFYAPLAGCSDFPFRQMSSLYRPGLMYCEMVKMDALVRNDMGTYRILDYSSDMHPIGAQLCGSKVELARPCAKILEDLGFDVIDLNCGCPVDKVTKDGSGSGLLKNLAKIGDIVSEMKAAVKVPVTVKIRAGWDEDELVVPEVVSVVEKAGASALCIHGRTREQGYRGAANWDHIKICKQAAKSLLIIGNGDVFSGEAAARMFAYTGCDAILVSRGTLGCPEILQDIYAALGEGGAFPHLNRGEIFLAHCQKIFLYQNEKKALSDLRRISAWYLKQNPAVKGLKDQLLRAQTLADAAKILRENHWADASFWRETTWDPVGVPEK